MTLRSDDVQLPTKTPAGSGRRRLAVPPTKPHGHAVSVDRLGRPSGNICNFNGGRQAGREGVPSRVGSAMRPGNLCRPGDMSHHDARGFVVDLRDVNCEPSEPAAAAATPPPATSRPPPGRTPPPRRDINARQLLLLVLLG